MIGDHFYVYFRSKLCIIDLVKRKKWRDPMPHDIFIPADVKRGIKLYAPNMDEEVSR